MNRTLTSPVMWDCSSKNSVFKKGKIKFIAKKYIHSQWVSYRSIKNSPVLGWGGLSKKPNIKMSKRMSTIGSYVQYVNCQKVKQLDYGWKKSSKFDLNVNFPIEPLTIKNCNAPLDALMCSLQIINWH